LNTQKEKENAEKKAKEDKIKAEKEEKERIINLNQ